MPDLKSPASSTSESVALDDPGVSSDRPRRLSVIIPNYNYGVFIGESIASALAIDWPDVEVVVVDDGSTDHSRQVIESFGDRVRGVFQPNCGNLEACNHGFAVSTGDVVYILDSDDRVRPQLMREVAAVWSARVAKVQFQLQTIDRDGQPSGTAFPRYRVVPSPEQVLQVACAIGNYPGPNTAGNVYARRFLERIFPLKPVAGRFSDTYCIAAAPFNGDVVTIAKPLAEYRVHGANDCAMTDLDGRRFASFVDVAMKMFDYARSVAREKSIEIEPRAIDRSLHTLASRVASLRLARASHPCPGDTRTSVAWLLVNALRYPQGVGSLQSLALVIWGLATLAAPSALATRLVTWRFVPTSRPAALSRLMMMWGIVRASKA